jgi:hypothetical protein
LDNQVRAEKFFFFAYREQGKGISLQSRSQPSDFRGRDIPPYPFHSFTEPPFFNFVFSKSHPLGFLVDLRTIQTFFFFSMYDKKKTNKMAKKKLMAKPLQKLFGGFKGKNGKRPCHRILIFPVRTTSAFSVASIPFFFFFSRANRNGRIGFTLQRWMEWGPIAKWVFGRAPAERAEKSTPRPSKGPKLVFSRFNFLRGGRKDPFTRPPSQSRQHQKKKKKKHPRAGKHRTFRHEKKKNAGIHAAACGGGAQRREKLRVRI